MDKTKKKNLVYNLITILILIVFLFPIYWMVITSLKTTGEIFAEVPTFFPKKITLNGYISQLSVVGTVPLWKNFANSFMIAAATTLVSTGLATLSAYGLARFRLKLSKPLLFIVLVTQMMPMELQEAATIDGCGRFKTFTKIMVPVSYPGIVVSAAFTFLWGWGDLMGALTFIQTDALQPLTVNMYKAIGEFGIEWNNLMAYAVILTIPVLIIFLFLQKYLISGITAGAVKA